jgi:hypothetical protein
MFRSSSGMWLNPRDSSPKTALRPAAAASSAPGAAMS